MKAKNIKATAFALALVATMSLTGCKEVRTEKFVPSILTVESVKGNRIRLSDHYNNDKDYVSIEYNNGYINFVNTVGEETTAIDNKYYSSEYSLKVSDDTIAHAIMGDMIESVNAGRHFDPSPYSAYVVAFKEYTKDKGITLKDYGAVDAYGVFSDTHIATNYKYDKKGNVISKMTQTYIDGEFSNSEEYYYKDNSHWIINNRTKLDEDIYKDIRQEITYTQESKNSSHEEIDIYENDIYIGKIVFDKNRGNDGYVDVVYKEYDSEGTLVNTSEYTEFNTSLYVTYKSGTGFHSMTGLSK